MDDYERVAPRFGKLVARHPDFHEATHCLVDSEEQLAAPTASSQREAAPAPTGDAGYPMAPAEPRSGWSDTVDAMQRRVAGHNSQRRHNDGNHL